MSFEHPLTTTSDDGTLEPASKHKEDKNHTKKRENTIREE
jgi:hypothetical protein